MSTNIALSTTSAVAAASQARDLDPLYTTIGWSGVAAGIFIGVILLPAVYNAVFYSVLRKPFLLWHSARSVALVLLTVSLSPLWIGDALAVESDGRKILGFLGFDLAIGLTGPFIRSYLEPGRLSPWLDRALGWTLPLTLLFIPSKWIFAPPAFYTMGRLLVFMGTLLLLIAALTQALKRSSRAGRYQVVAQSPTLALCAVSLTHHIVVGVPIDNFLAYLFGAIFFEILVTPLGIADRFMVLKKERDAAHERGTHLAQAARSDPLTGLSNRRGLEERFADANAPAIGSLAMVDLDHFKRINDNYGHDVGDQVLIAAAAALSSGSAFAARLGGEEFVLLLPTCASDEAERLRVTISDEVARCVPALGHRATASMGVVQSTPGATLRDLLNSADERLYRAKAGGRDRSMSDDKPGARPMAA